VLWLFFRLFVIVSSCSVFFGHFMCVFAFCGLRIRPPVPLDGRLGKDVERFSFLPQRFVFLFMFLCRGGAGNDQRMVLRQARWYCSSVISKHIT
jgi:hypothetical protein